MIYTLTVNPCVDYHMSLEHTSLQVGEINRSEGEEVYPGGKGLNVSVVLSRLGVENVAWGFGAGRIGKLVKHLAKDQGCNVDLLWLPDGETRINVKLDGRIETAINGRGPEITVEAMAELLVRSSNLTGDDILVLSGFSQTGSGSLYYQVCQAATGAGASLVVDAQGKALSDTFCCHPFLIKPNEEELLGLFSETDHSEDTYVRLMGLCQDAGVRNILLSLGKDGALLLCEDGRLYRARIEDDKKVISTVGAGDSMVAGFITGYTESNGDFKQAFYMGVATGSASAFSENLATRTEVEALLKTIK
ncbi:MAG: hexose kinase [Selenomonadaceae bacterium]|nr:hexose kinase [Selenomonadaceae bacterium]